MTFTLTCGDVMPGCTAVFRNTDRDELLGQVAAHASADHGLRVITPDVAEVVASRIVTA